MLADDMRRAIMAAPRAALDDFARANWRAFAAGEIDEAIAQQLAELIETRKIVPSKLAKPRRHVGSRPRSPASMHRRRRWAASSWLPPRLAERFTQAEQGALGVIMAEIALMGRCELCHGAIAGRAGVSVSTVKRAMAEARRLGLIGVEERRVSRFRNLPNIVTILSAELRTWVATRARGHRAARDTWGEGGGVQTGTTSESISSHSTSSAPPVARDRASRWAGGTGSALSRQRQRTSTTIVGRSMRG